VGTPSPTTASSTVPAASPRREDGRGDVPLGGSSASPSISVVVVAHTRVEFLRRAVESAISQHPDEVLVVKYSHDAEVDRELAELGARLHWSRQPFQGGKVAEGIEIARGDAVLLLDDDDVFLPGKVERARSAFRDPEVVCYTNRYLPFTDRPPEAGPSGTVRIFETGRGNQFREGLKPVLASCLGARRSMALPWLDDLRGLTIADHTLFMMAVTARRKIAMDQSVLTGYHVGRVEGALRPAQSIWKRPGATAQHDIAWMLDLVEKQSDGVRETLNPMVANAVIHLVFLTEDTHFREYRRTMRLILNGVGLRRPLTIPSALMFGYPISPRLAVSLNRTWKSLVGFHHHQG